MELQRYQNKKIELEEKVKNFDILIITETKWQKEYGLYFSGFKSIIKTSIGNSGGIVMLIKNYIEFDVIDTWQNSGIRFDILGIRTKNLNMNINLIAVYRRPSERITRRNWKEILEFDRRNMESIIAGDFNAHNTMWNCFNTDTHDENLLETMNDDGFVCCNTDTESRFGDTG